MRRVYPLIYLRLFAVVASFAFLLVDLYVLIADKRAVGHAGSAQKLVFFFRNTALYGPKAGPTIPLSVFLRRLKHRPGTVTA